MSDNLKWSRVTFEPVAECESCPWRSSGRTATTDAKRHARQKPGHSVYVEQVTRGVYCVPVEEKA